MNVENSVRRYRFGIFEADAVTGELRRQGMRVKLNSQPFQMLLLLLERPGELVTREDVCRRLWPDGTFVDYEHGVNSAVNRIREALGDTAVSPRFIETLARRGYRFVAPVETLIDSAAGTSAMASNEIPSVPAGSAPAKSDILSSGSRFLAGPDDLPANAHSIAVPLFLMLQVMYLAFYVGALANLAEIEDLVSMLRGATEIYLVVFATAALLIPVRAFTICVVLFRAPGVTSKLLRLWPFLFLADELWALSPFLLLHHINAGLALACTALLVYSPFAQRSLVLMGAGAKTRGK
jgi:cholera toxin transcriptional activator